MEEEKTEIDPAEYFNPEAPVPPTSFLAKVWIPTVLGGAGVGAAVLLNAFNRRPFFSGLQQHGVLASLGVLLGVTSSNWLQRRHAHRDLVLYNYIVSHPEDFPPIERKKYAEVLESWVPIR